MKKNIQVILILLVIAVLMLKLALRQWGRGRVITTQVAGTQAMIGVLPA